MSYRLDNDYLHYLKALDGIEFQDEIVKLYAESKNDFQPVRAAGGDGGSDGLFNEKSSNLCCYGIDHKITSQDKKDNESKIKTKFEDDLKRILELDSKGKGKKKQFNHHENKKLLALLPTGKKFKVIHLAVNHDDNKLIKYFTDLFTELKKHSQMRFVEPNCDVIFVGLDSIKVHCNITEASLVRLKYREIEESVQLIFSFDKNQLPSPASGTSDFDDKFSYLEKNFGNDGDKLKVIQSMKEKYFDGWCRYIAFMQNLQKKSPSIFQAATKEHKRIIEKLNRDFLGAEKEPNEKINSVQEEIHDKWKRIFDNNDTNQKDNLADMDTGNLIGTCPLDWRKSGKKSA